MFAVNFDKTSCNRETKFGLDITFKGNVTSKISKYYL